MQLPMTGLHDLVHQNTTIESFTGPNVMIFRPTTFITQEDSLLLPRRQGSQSDVCPFLKKMKSADLAPLSS